MRMKRLAAVLAGFLAAAIMLPISPQPAMSFPAAPLSESSQKILANVSPDMSLARSSRRIYRPRPGYNRPGYNRPGYNRPGHWNGHRPGHGGYWYNNNHYNGYRYRYRYPGYNHYYGGFWYANPWWLYGAYNYRPAGGSAHKRWCSDRYRSYNPSTNRYLGKDGKYHRCNSPYD